jgi:hypothetical protein
MSITELGPCWCILTDRKDDYRSIFNIKNAVNY